MVIARFQESCMIHVQVPLILGVLCGTLAYVSIFRVSDRLAEEFVKMHRDELSRDGFVVGQQRLTDSSSIGGGGGAAVEATPERESPSIVDALPIVQRKKPTGGPIRAKPTANDSKPKASSSADSLSICDRMKNKYKTEYPAAVEFPMADDCHRWDEFAREIRRCTVDQLKTKSSSSLDAWNQLRRAVACCSSGIYQMLSVTPLTKGSDTKFVVFPSSPTLPCYAVSIGLGKDLDTARKLHDIMPQCEQYAAERDPELARPFREIGEVHELSLDPRPPPSDSNRTTFLGFLQSHIRVPEIDYLFVNARDGSEFYLLKWLLDQGRRQQQSTEDKIPICFVTMDLRGPLDRIGISSDDYDKEILKFLEESEYLILYGSSVKNRQRLFLLNSREPFCVEKYFGQWCKPAESK